MQGAPCHFIGVTFTAPLSDSILWPVRMGLSRESQVLCSKGAAQTMDKNFSRHNVPMTQMATLSAKAVQSATCHFIGVNFTAPLYHFVSWPVWMGLSHDSQVLRSKGAAQTMDSDFTRHDVPMTQIQGDLLFASKTSFQARHLHWADRAVGRMAG